MRNQPSGMAAAVSAGRRQYPFITLCPRMAISPTSPGATSLPSQSTTRIWTPSIGVPIEPGFRSRSGWLNEATGEVSDSP